VPGTGALGDEEVRAPHEGRGGVPAARGRPEVGEHEQVLGGASPASRKSARREAASAACPEPLAESHEDAQRLEGVRAAGRRRAAWRR